MKGSSATFTIGSPHSLISPPGPVPKLDIFGGGKMQRELSSVLALNDRGVVLVAAGEFQAASLVFRNALQRIRTVALQTTTSQGLPQDDDDNHQPVLLTAAWKLTSAVPAACDFDDIQLSCACFHRGFTIGARPQDQRRTSPPDYELLVATILYNTALAYDMRRKRNVQNQLGCIQRACHLYEQALSLLQSMPMADEDNRLLLLATANNRAVLALEMRDYDTFEEYRDFLGQLILPTEVFSFNFFACNLLATASVRGRPAPAA